jgi:hypothetical protein
MRVTHAHRTLTAWLGLLAIWLGVVMPVVSQGIRSQDPAALETTICMADGSDHQVRVPLDAPHDGHGLHTGWQACGYCGLLALHLPVAPVIARASLAETGSAPAATVSPPTVDLPPAHTPAIPRAPPSSRV